jgi:HAD superfamily hydrolase (TIGR01490 family)
MPTVTPLPDRNPEAPGASPAAPGDLAPRDLALFDLDYTLLPIDSDYEWARFLIRLGVVDGAEYDRRNDAFFEQYHAGTLDILEFLAFQLAPLAAHPVEQLDAWRERFVDEVIRPRIVDAARALVDRHRTRGDLCAIVTATNEFVTRPIADEFGIEHLVATRIETADGRYTGRPLGTPSFREGKVQRTAEWLASLGRSWSGFARSHFYSDSANDVPLLERVTDPVATNPDARLAALARERGWRTMRLFE